MYKYKEKKNLNCSCDICSLKKAKQMEQYLSAQGQPPPYVTSWPIVTHPQPRVYNEQPYQATQGYNLQQYQSERIYRPILPRGIPFVFAQPSQLQGPTYSSPARVPQQIPYPAAQSESRRYLLSETMHSNTSSLTSSSLIQTSPTLNSQETTSKTPIRPGGVAYDHSDLPKIVAVHSLPSSPVCVRERLREATLLPGDLQGSFVFESTEKDTHPSRDDTLTRPNKECLENRYSAIESRATDALADPKLIDYSAEKTYVEQKDVQDNDIDQSVKVMVKREMNPVEQSAKSPQKRTPQHHNEAVNDTNVGQESDELPYADKEIPRPEDAGRHSQQTREMRIKDLIGKINSLHQDFNKEVDENKRWKMFNHILDARSELEKLRINKSNTNQSKPGLTVIVDAKDQREVEENTRGGVMVNDKGTVPVMANIGITKADKTKAQNDDMMTANISTVEVGGDDGLSARTSEVSVRRDIITTPDTTKFTIQKFETEIKTNNEAQLCTNRMSSSSNIMTPPYITMETNDDSVMSPNKVCPLSNTMTSPDITMETNSDGTVMIARSDIKTNDVSRTCTKKTLTFPNTLTSSNVTMETKSVVITTTDVKGNDKFTMNTDTPNNTRISNTITTKNVTMATENVTMATENVTMVTTNVTKATKNDSMVTDQNVLFQRRKDSTVCSQDFGDCAANLDSKEVSKTESTSSLVKTTIPKGFIKSAMLQPRIVVNLFDRINISNLRKKSVNVGAAKKLKTNEEDCVKGLVTAEAQQTESFKSHETVNLCQSETLFREEDDESQRSSPVLPNSFKDPFGCTEIEERQQEVEDSKIAEKQTFDDIWTMELDETSHKAIFRRRWKRTGGPFDKKIPACVNKVIGDDSLTDNKGERLCKSMEYLPPLKKRALLELRIVDDDDQIALKDTDLSPLRKTLTSSQDEISAYYKQDSTMKKKSTDEDESVQDLSKSGDSEMVESYSKEHVRANQYGAKMSAVVSKKTNDETKSIEDLLTNDLEMVKSHSNELLSSFQGDDEEIEWGYNEDEQVEESVFILERSLQLRESKINTLNEKKEHLLDELRRIKATDPSSLPRDL